MPNKQQKIGTKKTFLTILSEEEIDMINKFRENKKKQEDFNKIVKVGFLKRDIVLRSDFNNHIIINPGIYPTTSLAELQAEVKEFFNTYCLKKGTPFYCRIIDGEEYWSDGNDFLEEKSEWAKENLQKVRKYEK